MDTVSYTALRNDLASLMDKVNEDSAPLLVTRQNGQPAVLMSLEDFQGYEETAYLMKSPKNAARLNQSIAELRNGGGTDIEVIRNEIKDN